MKIHENELVDLGEIDVSQLIAKLKDEPTVQALISASDLHAQAQELFAEAGMCFGRVTDAKSKIESLGKEKVQLEKDLAKVNALIRLNEEKVCKAVMDNPERPLVEEKFVGGEFKKELLKAAREFLATKEDFTEILKKGKGYSDRMNQIPGEIAKQGEVARQAKEDGDTIASKAREIEAQAKLLVSKRESW